MRGVPSGQKIARSGRTGNIPTTNDAYNCAMTKKLLIVFTLALALAFVALAADPTGKWIYEQAGFGGRGGGGGGTPPPPVTVTLTLKAEGSTLTGSQSRPGRGGDPMVSDIKNGKVDGDTITFTTEQPGRGGGDPVTITYKGTVKGDTIDLEITRPGRGGDPMTTKVTAKKATT